MTPFPGGKVSPGHFVPPAGASDAIFVRSTGALYTHFDLPNLDGITPLDIPAGRQAGDLLVVITTGYSTAPAEDASTGNYVQFAVGGGSFWRMLSRIATNDANDDCSIVASASGLNAVRTAQVIALGVSNPLNTATFLEFLPLLSQAGINLTKAALTVASQPDVLIIGVTVGIRQLPAPLRAGPYTVTSPYAFDLSSEGYGALENGGSGTPTYFFSTAGHSFQPVASAEPAALIVHTPASVNVMANGTSSPVVFNSQ